MPLFLYENPRLIDSRLLIRTASQPRSIPEPKCPHAHSNSLRLEPPRLSNSPQLLASLSLLPGKPSILTPPRSPANFPPHCSRVDLRAYQPPNPHQRAMTSRNPAPTRKPIPPTLTPPLTPAPPAPKQSRMPTPLPHPRPPCINAGASTPSPTTSSPSPLPLHQHHQHPPHRRKTNPIPFPPQTTTPPRPRPAQHSTLPASSSPNPTHPPLQVSQSTARRSQSLPVLPRHRRRC